jgi:hypothetical protein
MAALRARIEAARARVQDEGDWYRCSTYIRGLAWRVRQNPEETGIGHGDFHRGGVRLEHELEVRDVADTRA